MSATVSYEDVFHALALGGAKAVLRRYFTPDSCINSTRVLLEVFQTLGLAADPVSVELMVLSPGFVERATQEGHMPTDPELRESSSATWFLSVVSRLNSHWMTMSAVYEVRVNANEFTQTWIWCFASRCAGALDGGVTGLIAAQDYAPPINWRISPETPDSR